MSDAIIRALTDGFDNMINSMLQAPVSGPLQSIKKFNPAEQSARNRMKKFEEAACLSNWTDPLAKSGFSLI